MEIKILGPGCPNCKQLEKITFNAIAELGIEAEVKKITDIKEITKYLLITPGLVINGKIKHTGMPLPNIEKIKNWVLEEKK
jgi:small redox-active disulfide protein 2